MAVQKLLIQDFLPLTASLPVLDVRSPGEFNHAHIPGAYNLPLFTDEERVVVGTAYKQQSREKAIKLGLDYFGVKMSAMVQQVEQWLKERKTPVVPGAEKPAVLVHCWRGGMRSAGVAWLLDLYGFKVTTLVGGYKGYRQWVRQQFEQPYSFKVLGGYTGSGKTQVLHELQSAGEQIIDLEQLARHRGSAFGALKEPQPTQEMFENQLAAALHHLHQTHPKAEIFIEDESQRIGTLCIPNPLWKQLRNSPVLFLDIPFEERLTLLIEQYGPINKEQLVNAILRIQKRLGGLETKTAINYLIEDNLRESFRILLQYYDKCYSKALQTRPNLASLLQQMPTNSTAPKPISQQIIYDSKSNL